MKVLAAYHEASLKFGARALPGVRGLGLGVKGFGFRVEVYGLEFGVYGLEVWALGGAWRPTLLGQIWRVRGT